ncbi:MAG TPA: peptidoglycan DD-metalloendopeptidase family protein [Burkholderiaceae bacterium]|nr:peptidoglycan DD-metalloendopeptidase family protein [Burkholderiaceae bacterium]
MPRDANHWKVPGCRPVTAFASLVAVGLLMGCSETSLNEAPIVDRSTRQLPSTQTERTTSVEANTAAQDVASGWYTVQKGDTLYHISTTFHCSVQDLARWNGIAEGTALSAGQRLRVRAPGAAPGDTSNSALAAPAESAEASAAEVHAVPMQATGVVETRGLDMAPVGATPVPPKEAAAGSTPPANQNSSTAVPAEATVAPGVAKAGGGESAGGAVAMNLPPAAEKPTASVPWIWPVEGKVSSKFDATHTKGIEITTSEGSKVLAVADGEVSYTGAPRDYGNLVIVRHPDGLLSVYAHTKAILVTQGQAVKRGQAIATAGKADRAEPSLHFEVRRQGVPIDPLELLPPR